MASVRKTPRNPKKWEVRYRDPGGTQRTKGGFTTKADAKAFRARIEDELNRDQWRDPRLMRMTVRAWCDQYMRTGRNFKRASTYARDQRHIDRYLLPYLGDVPISAVRPTDIQQIMDSLSYDLQPSTIRGILGVIKAVFNGAVTQDVLLRSPCRGIKIPPVRSTEKMRLDENQLEHLASAIQAEYRPFVHLGGVLGLRFSEIAGLRVGSVDFLRGTLSITQTVSEVEGRLSIEDVKTPSSRRTISVPQFLIEIVSEHLAAQGRREPDDFILTSPAGGPLRYSNFHRNVWTPAVRSAGLEGFKIHGLRHTAAALMIKLDAHPKVIQQVLGHASIGVTMNVYGSLLPGVQDGVTGGLEAMFSDARGADVVQDGSDDRFRA